jgi:hypothetical protein
MPFATIGGHVRKTLRSVSMLCETREVEESGWGRKERAEIAAAFSSETPVAGAISLEVAEDSEEGVSSNTSPSSLKSAKADGTDRCSWLFCVIAQDPRDR